MVVVATICATVGIAAGTTVASAAAKPKAGGSVKYLTNTAWPSFDPADRATAAVPSSTSTASALFVVFDGLVVSDAVTGTAKPRIATLTSKDSTVFTMKIHPDVKFSDGTVLDAQAVKTNWDRLNTTAIAPGKANFANISSWVVTDPLTLTVTLKTATPDFPYLLGTWAQNFIVSPKQLSTNVAGVVKSPVGAGPYMVTEFIINDHATLTRNPNYYGKTYLDSITFQYVSDESQRLATMRSGGADLARTSDVVTASQAKQAGLQVTDLQVAGGQAVTFNTVKPPFDDLRARQAIAYVFDSKAMSKAVFGGAGVPVESLFPKGSPFYQPSIKQLAPNDKKAQDLFNELAAAGKPLSFTLSTTTTTGYVQMSQWLQTKLATFKNVTMKLEPLATTLASDRLIPGNFQAALYVPFGAIPSELATFFQTGGGKNYGKFSDPVMDAAIVKGNAATTQQARVAASKEMQAEWVKQVPHFMVIRNSSFVILGKNIHGYKPDANWLNQPDWTAIWKSAA
jgi:peptide/nickel transport system substrate-binding protein